MLKLNILNIWIWLFPDRAIFHHEKIIFICEIFLLLKFPLLS